jgi:hypothetical protein
MPSPVSLSFTGCSDDQLAWRQVYLRKLPTCGAQVGSVGDLVEMKLHSFAVAGRQHEGCAGAAIGQTASNRLVL